MITFLFGLVGAGIGAFQARRRKGALPDILQYAAVYGIIGLLLGLFLTIVVARVA